MSSRTQKSILNIEVSFTFYILSLFLTFFSRKIFLENLGATFIGLTGTISSILGILNLSELGINLSISFFLYKPLTEKETNKMNEIISLVGYLYKFVGYFIIGSGILISLLFPIIFRGCGLPYSIIYFTFYSFLISSAITYLINYRQILLDADQKRYIVSIYSNSFAVAKTLLQIFLALSYKNLYVWVSIEFISVWISCIILNWKIKKEYPWLSPNLKKGPILLKEYPNVLKKTKQILIHELKDFILNKSDEIMIFAFVSLKTVAYYGNYTMIIGKLSTLFILLFNSTGAGIGNLVAESNKNHILNVFWQLSSMKYLSAGILIICLSFLINPFIEWWLGKEYVLNNKLIILFMIYLFIMQTRSIIDMFNHSYGLYGDVWAAWAEGIINIFITIAICIKWGIYGILLGKIVSLFFIITIWKPYYLFSHGFKEPVSTYWHNVFWYYICFGIAFSYMYISSIIFDIHPNSTFMSMVNFVILEILPTICIYTSLLYFIGPGTQDFLKRFSIFRR
jgi:O-antigen/teichoic acid export membrane protein